MCTGLGPGLINAGADGMCVVAGVFQHVNTQKSPGQPKRSQTKITDETTIQFKIWTGETAPRAVMRDALEIN
jgi:hypothetical protein